MNKPGSPFASLARLAMLSRVFRIVVVRAAMLLLPIAAVVVLLVALARNDADRFASLVVTALAIVAGAALLIAGIAVLVVSLIWKRVSSRLGAFGSLGGLGALNRPGTPSPPIDPSGRKVIEVDAARGPSPRD